MRKIEYSRIAARKLKALRAHLTAEFGSDVSEKSMKLIAQAVRGLETFPEKGKAVSALFDIESDYRLLYIKHNYLFYRIEENRIIIVEVFDEREDFIYKLFGITTTSSDTLDHWDE